MALRGKIPEGKPRLRALVSSRAGVGKTTCLVNMPSTYIIDSESGTEHYRDIMREHGCVAMMPEDGSTNINAVIDEIRTLATVKHPYTTVAFDPLTTLWEQAVIDATEQVGDAYGKHTALAGRWFNRLMQLLYTLDMNVFFTAHAKVEYKDGETIGDTFDGWKKSDYIADVHFQLERNPMGDRLAKVRKTRLSTEFPDQSTFRWSYDEVANRFGRDRFEREAATVTLAGEDEIAIFEGLLKELSDKERKRLKIDRVLAAYDDLADMPAERMKKGIDVIRAHLAKA